MMNYKLFKYFVIVLILFENSVSAQVAYLHRDSVLRAVPNYTVRLQKVAELQKQHQEEIEESRKHLQKKLNQLLGPYNPKEKESFTSIKIRMKPMDTLRLNLILEEDQTLEKKEQTYTYMVRFEYDQKVKPLLEKVNKVILNYAKQNKIDAIYALGKMKPSLVYVNERSIITSQIIALIKKEYAKK